MANSRAVFGAVAAAVLLVAGCSSAGTSIEPPTAPATELQTATSDSPGPGNVSITEPESHTDTAAPDVAGASEPVSAPSVAVDEPAPAVPPELANAIAAASNYLSFSPFSEKGLIRQLSSEAGDGYPQDVAAAAVASLDVDWDEQAEKAAANYLSLMSFSKQGLIEQLESDSGDGYTHEQAVHGAEQAYGVAEGTGGGSSSGGGSAELANAVAAAENYLSLMPFSEKGLIEQLSSGAGDGYSPDAAAAAVKSLNVDWNAQAAKAAANYLGLMSFSKQELIDQLIFGDGYTRAQAEYGVGKAYR